MVRAINMGWYVLNKYYTCTDDVPAYRAALLLDPSSRRAYLDKNWEPVWIKPTIEAASKLWEEEFNTKVTEDHRPNSTVDELVLNSFAKLKEMQKVQYATAAAADDFHVFIMADPIDIESLKLTPLEWWCQPVQRLAYPRLSRMAISILSIPAESAEPERVFSGARRTCSWSRLRLTPRNIEIIECIGDWLMAGYIRSIQASGVGLPVTPNPEVDKDEAAELDQQLIECVEAELGW